MAANDGGFIASKVWEGGVTVRGCIKNLFSFKDVKGYFKAFFVFVC